MQIVINGLDVPVKEGQTVLDVAHQVGIWIPTLCHHQGLEPYAACRLCLVEVDSGGRQTLAASCALPVADGMVVETDTPRVRQAREMIMQLHLASTQDSPRVQELARLLGIEQHGLARHGEWRCTLCGLCVRACHQVGADAIGFTYRGSRRRVTAPFRAQATDCLGCQACAEVCPSGIVVFSEAGGRLLGPHWHSDVRMINCAGCGKYFLPQPLAGRLQQLGLELINTDRCPECRRKLAGDRLATEAGRADGHHAES
ncbi:MAG: 2Fe-2S iron-sulfur cluster-binding protein [Thermacetogeniaceae bacterium]